jgi:hypothetical protein
MTFRVCLPDGGRPIGRRAERVCRASRLRLALSPSASRDRPRAPPIVPFLVAPASTRLSPATHARSRRASTACGDATPRPPSRSDARFASRCVLTATTRKIFRKIFCTAKKFPRFARFPRRDRAPSSTSIGDAIGARESRARSVARRRHSANDIARTRAPRHRPREQPPRLAGPQRGVDAVSLTGLGVLFQSL